MILSKEVAKIKRGPSHCLETYHVVYNIFDVVRQIITARCLQDTTAQLPLPIILVSLLVGNKLLIILVFPRKFSKI